MRFLGFLLMEALLLGTITSQRVMGKHTTWAEVFILTLWTIVAPIILKI